MPAINLITRRFGKLTVVRKLDERLGGAVLWQCTCDCGRTTKVPTSKLNSGRTQSCGCGSSNFQRDLTGEKFGLLTVVQETGKVLPHMGRVLLCRCDCGNTTTVPAARLQYRASCGCKRIKVIEMAGKRIGQLLVIRLALTGSGEGAVWECLCDCGTATYVYGGHLRSGRTLSCGCLVRQKLDVYRIAVARRFQVKTFESDINFLYKQYQRAAMENDREWSIERTDFETLVQQHCSYCGIPPSQIRQSPQYGNTRYTGIDRIDSNLGYTLANSAPCCYMCNQAKSNVSVEQFKEWIFRAATYLSQQSDSTVDIDEARAVV